MSQTKYYPKCFNSKCSSNMGNSYSKGYSYLNNSCYHNTDTNDFINCRIRQEKESNLIDNKETSK